MNTFAFDADGRCLFFANEVVEDDAAAVVHTELKASPNEVWYSFEEGEIKMRTPFNVTVSTNKIEQVPSGTTVWVGVEQAVVTDGVFEIEVSMPEVVKVVMDHPRHHMAEVEVTCEVSA